ncbi:MAG: hypothetical protein US96_C0001G0012 [Candidatus Woesebacteria bacterium GW2011_GWB1_38_5b]|uniref:Major facilitator superfamily (MFS) profile domain-containing protein n=1 Tax=Candidatus Woesebacteria bacterium GW2011_GWB1_38_5b TaxID=1618569 RepID=A0A0G0NFP4_9BACT|nr:MAG: hypothetical protein US96_C0001G0012 [Candidatus Woesebacteria bacterium GW2011_GWB1_38_5b]
MKEFLELIKNKNFVRLWISQIISQVTLNTLSFLILIRLFEQTGSTIATSFVWVAYALPAIIVGPIGAVCSDIFNKKKLLMLTNLSQAITIALLAIFFQKYIYFSYAAVFIYSFFNQFYVPAEASTLPNIVSKKRLPQANSLFFVTVQSGFVLGFVFAGILYDAVGFGTTLFIAAVGLVVAFLTVSGLPSFAPLEHIPKDIEKGVSRFFQEIVEGYKFIKNNKTILFPFALLIGLQVALSILVVTIPVIASEIVKIRPSIAGIVVGFPAAAGALTGTFFVSKLLSRNTRKRKIIESSIFALSISVMLLSDIVPAVNFWIGRSLAVTCFFVTGLAYVGGLIPTITYLQEVTPKDLLGRVFGNIWFITTVATVIPVLFSATITEIFGVNLMLTVLGIIGMSVIFVSKFHQSKFFKAYVKH